MISSQPRLVSNGVAFAVYVDYVKRECVISADALTKLSELGAGEADLMQTFCAYEANINGIARRLVAAGVPHTPLQLNTQNFNDLQRRRPE
jgi:hypothetical protein